ncbi:MAG: MBL fold metallo-hydrolase [archaeon]|nr:MAG: MBL fold metallo-hydrolase [archaeon]
MGPRLTCFGGVGEIGGNKFLLEDSGSKVLLDFGTGFVEGADYFDSFIAPRGVNGAGDLFEFGLLPQIEGLYSEESLQNTKMRYTDPEVDGVVLSHYHSDHMGRISYIDPKIPVYCGETTALIHDAYSEASGSPLDGRELRKFRTGDSFKVGAFEFVPVHVDHSIPGAYGFVIHHSEGTMAYTGDFRFHGPAGRMTQDFLDAAQQAKPDVLLTEGTRVREGDGKSDSSEEEVLQEATSIVAGTQNLAFSTFRGNDVDRINTFDAAAKKTGRTLVVSMKTAVLLEKLAADKKLKVPRVGDEVRVYVKRKRSGTFEDSDYRPWERRFLDHGITATEVSEKQGSVFLHLEAWNFPELVDIKPRPGGVYIHAATEAFNEEGEREEGVIRNWIDHLGFDYRQLHASGHAPMRGVEDAVAKVGAKVVIPIHTERPDLFATFKGKEAWTLRPPAKGVPLSLSDR